MLTGIVLYALSWGVFWLAPRCMDRMQEAMTQGRTHAASTLAWAVLGLFACLAGGGLHICGIVLIIKALFF
ncbi:MAG TPA: hypothetical protein VD862_03655 [Candidatus Paceibacterota bacterium]|nr:hypothetical protein [Candidatus Paceibacterota bacterium]